MTYGLAEATLGVCFAPADQPPEFDQVDRASLLAGTAVPSGVGETELAVLGPPLEGVSVDIIGTDGEVLPTPRSVGEVKVRGVAVCDEYDAGPRQEVMTGDLGYLKEDGQLVLVGRRKVSIVFCRFSGCEEDGHWDAALPVPGTKLRRSPQWFLEPASSSCG